MSFLSALGGFFSGAARPTTGNQSGIASNNDNFTTEVSRPSAPTSTVVDANDTNDSNALAPKIDALTATKTGYNEEG